MRFLEALSWAKSLILEKIIVEGDSKIVGDAIVHNCVSNYIFGEFIRAWRNILASCPTFR